MHRDELYDPRFVQRLFDEMAQTYGVVNLISSLGFAYRWRRQCVRSIEIVRGKVILDLMTGMGELCPDLARAVGPDGTIFALDISPVMCERARRHGDLPGGTSLHVIEANALECPIEDASVDYVFSTFGLKTLNHSLLRQLATEVHRVLRPGGQFAFLEISVPPSKLLRWPYLAYINYVIPRIGQLFLGNPDNYRLLGEYTNAFRDCRQAAESFSNLGMQVRYQSYFFGCSTGFTGRKTDSRQCSAQ